MSASLPRRAASDASINGEHKQGRKKERKMSASATVSIIDLLEAN